MDINNIVSFDNDIFDNNDNNIFDKIHIRMQQRNKKKLYNNSRRTSNRSRLKKDYKIF